MMSVVLINIAVGAALLIKFTLEQRRRSLADAHLASVVESWQRELTHH